MEARAGKLLNAEAMRIEQRMVDEYLNATGDPDRVWRDKSAVNGGVKTSQMAAQKSASSAPCILTVGLGERPGTRAHYIAGACQGALARRANLHCWASTLAFRARLWPRR
jgi:hypothetical protein